MVTTAKQLRPLTIEDLADFPEDGQRREIIDGELIVAAAPSNAHQIVVGRLIRLIGNFADQHELGTILPSPVDVRLTPNDVVEPDIVFVSKSRDYLTIGQFVDGPPDLVVEVLSPSTRRVDLVRKRALYARAGIQEYWIVDLIEQTLQVLELQQGRYDPMPAESGTASSKVLVGLKIDVTRVFAEIAQISLQNR